MKYFTAFLCALFISFASHSQDISGKWNGKISKTQFVFSFEKVEDGYETTLDIPTQRVFNIKPRITKVFGDSLVVDASNIGIIYKSIILENGTKITGFVTERANTFPLSLLRGDVKSDPQTNRPQEPVKPYPYYEEEVTFENINDKITLSGTLTLPNKGTQHPVVVLITGSGPQDRDQTFAGHKTFLVLADYLTRNGIGVLRYDDRGFGSSNGIFADATTYDFATDAISAVEYLKNRSDIDRSNIGLIGHSEGGIIAPLAANRSSDISFIISMAGTGITGSELVYNQVTSQRPFPVPNVADYEKAVKDAIDIASQDKDISVIKKELRSHYYQTIVPILTPLIGSDEKVAEAITNLINARTTKWMRYFYNYNPSNEIERLTVPILYMIGSNDNQVLPETNVKRIKDAFAKNNKNDNTLIQLDSLNHLFQQSVSGQMDEYQNIEETISPKALDEIRNWIARQVKPN